MEQAGTIKIIIIMNTILIPIIIRIVKVGSLKVALSTALKVD